MTRGGGGEWRNEACPCRPPLRAHYSAQVYGDQEQHRVPRAAAADYMEVERAWFGSFVVGDASEFDEYVAGVRRDGVWGDDPEIQVRFSN